MSVGWTSPPQAGCREALQDHSPQLLPTSRATDISKIIETFSIQGLHYYLCCEREGQGPSSSPCFSVHGGCDPLNCKGCHQLFRPKAGQDAFEGVCQKEWEYSCLLQLWPRSWWGAGTTFQAEQGSFRTLRPGSTAAHACMTGYESVLRTTLSNMGMLLTAASLLPLTLCASCAFQQHTARWSATQSSLYHSALQIMGACCVLQHCERTDFELKRWGTVSSEKLCTICCTLHMKHLRWHACEGCYLYLHGWRISEIRCLHVPIFSRN